MSSYSKDLVHMVVENFGYLHRQHLPMVIFNPFFFSFLFLAPFFSGDAGFFIFDCIQTFVLVS